MSDCCNGGRGGHGSSRRRHLAHEDAFTRVEVDAAAIAEQADDVRLSWFRLHNILLWMDVTRKRSPRADHLVVS
jgi:alpha-beta hydrolase superfamily lysophospholipase